MALEELLNKLIKRGWKPRGYEDVYEFKLYKLGYTIARPQKQKLISFATETRHYINGTDYIGYKGYSLRELVSKESGLRQFCVENNLVKLIENPNENKCPRDRMDEEEHRIWEYDVYYSFSTKKDIHKRYEQDSSTYRIIESSLKDESELEDFLIDNIKDIRGKQKRK